MYESEHAVDAPGAEEHGENWGGDVEEEGEENEAGEDEEEEEREEEGEDERGEADEWNGANVKDVVALCVFGTVDTGRQYIKEVVVLCFRGEEGKDGISGKYWCS